MRLTDNDKARLRCWREGECCDRDTSRPGNTEHEKPMLPKVCFSIVSRLTHDRKLKTARGQLRAARKAIDLVLSFLETVNNPGWQDAE